MITPTTVSISLGDNMAAILRDDETNKYFVQIVKNSFSGMKKEDIIPEELIGPFDDFETASKTIVETFT